MGETNQMWWDCESDSAHSTLASLVKSLDGNQGYQNDLAYLHLLLYDPAQTYSTVTDNIASLTSKLPTLRPRWNIIGSIIDTVIALVASNKLRIKFLTHGGTLAERELAVRQSDYLAGVFWGCDVFGEAKKAFKDACWHGNGYVKFYEEAGTVKCERIFPTEVKVDEFDGLHGKPRSMHHIKTVSRTYLLALYPDDKEEIASAQLLENRNPLTTKHTDPVSYCESWHLPSVKGAKDGRHVIWCSSCTLVDEEWEDDSFPISTIRYNDRSRGWNAQGLSELLRPTQKEVNRFLDKIHRHLNLAATKTFIKKGTKVDKKALNNKELGLVEWAGQIPPEIRVIAAIAPEYYQHLHTLYNRGFEIAGISALAATAEAPKGYTSGKALRTLSDQQSKRFMTLFQAWEKFHIDMGMQALLVLQRMSEKDLKSVEARAERGGKTYELDLKKLDIKTNTYHSRAYAVNALSDSPAGRYESIQESIAVDPRFAKVAMMLIDDPDLRAYNDRLMAPHNLTQMIISKILTGQPEEEVPEPDPYMTLPEMIEDMRLAVQEAVVNEEEEDRVLRLRQWIDEAIAMMKRLAPPPPPPVGPPMGPPGPPGPPIGPGAPGAPGIPIPPTGPVGGV